MFPILEAGPSLETASLPAFVVARDGLYLRKRSLLGLSQTKVGRIAHLPEGKEFLDYALPKVPAGLRKWFPASFNSRRSQSPDGRAGFHTIYDLRLTIDDCVFAVNRRRA